jgi:large subunit ribosomal protein L33
MRYVICDVRSFLFIHVHLFQRYIGFKGAMAQLDNLEVKRVAEKITLACTKCKRRNYNTMKNKKNTPDRIERKKHCRFCNEHLPHKETK